MRRYYLMPVITRVAPDGSLERLPDVADESASWVALHSIDPNKQGYCLVLVDAEDHAAIESSIENDAFPIIAPDAPLSDLFTRKQFDAIKKRLISRGIDVSTVTINSTMIETLVIIANHLRPGADSRDVKFKV